MDPKVKVGLESLDKARDYRQKNNPGRAFAHYLVYLELFPNQRLGYESEFADTLCTWGMLLEEENRFEDLCKCYIQALNYFPSSVDILTNLGTHLLRLEYEDAAKKYLEQAHRIDKNCLLAEKSLYSAKINAVQRWHFRMLNDYQRNVAYRRAIEATVSSTYSKVLDVGTGCGILSLFAAQCRDVKSIVAIEKSKAMTKIAKNVFENNTSVCPSIVLLQKSSIDVNSSDIEERANLLVTEIFDCALFGEHILETLIHAWNNLLEENSKVIPCAADVFVTGISSPELSRKHKFLGSYPDIKLSDLCITTSNGDPYEAEKLQNKNVTYVTDTAFATRVDFEDVHQLEAIRSVVNYVPQMVLKSEDGGTVEAFAVWFTLYLDDSTLITTSPFEDSVKCWEQCVVYLDHPIILEKGEELKVQMSVVEDVLHLDVCDKQLPECAYCHKVSEELLAFMNDSNLMDVLYRVAKSFEAKVEDGESFELLDCLPLPLFALILGRKGAGVCCVSKSEIDRTFIEALCEANEIESFRVVPEKHMEHFVDFEHIFDIMSINPVARSGNVNESCVRDFDLFQNSLKPNGLFVPQAVDAVVEIIESDYLSYCSTVDDKYLFGLKIAQYVNEYAVPEQWIVNPRTYPHKKLSNAVTTRNILVEDNSPKISKHEVTITESGTANGILYWYKLTICGNVCISTYESENYHSAIFIFDEPKEVKKGDLLTINVKQHRGLLKIYCDDV